MRKIDLSRIEAVKPFINYEGENIQVEITEISQIPNGGIRYTLENLEDNHIHFLKFYMTEKGLPFYKKFIEDTKIDEKIGGYPTSLLGQRLSIKTIFVNQKAKITKIVECNEKIEAIEQTGQTTQGEQTQQQQQQQQQQQTTPNETYIPNETQF